MSHPFPPRYDVAGCSGAATPEAKAATLLQYRFVGRCLAKCLFDGHTCLEASPNVKILKFLVGEPVVFDDLQLVDEALWMSLRKLRSVPDDDFAHLMLTFEVTRVLRRGAPLAAGTPRDESSTVETVELFPGGGDVAVTHRNLERFFELRLREAVFEAHRDELAALLAGFHDLVPPHVMLLPGQEKGAKFPTSKAHISVIFHSFWLIFGRVIISRNGLERERLSLERARAELPS